MWQAIHQYSNLLADRWETFHFTSSISDIYSKLSVLCCVVTPFRTSMLTFRYCIIYQRNHIKLEKRISPVEIQSNMDTACHKESTVEWDVDERKMPLLFITGVLCIVRICRDVYGLQNWAKSYWTSGLWVFTLWNWWVIAIIQSIFARLHKHNMPEGPTRKVKP